MKRIPVRESAGLSLCHDLAEIVPGERKITAFRRNKWTAKLSPRQHAGGRLVLNGNQTDQLPAQLA